MYSCQSQIVSMLSCKISSSITLLISLWMTNSLSVTTTWKTSSWIFQSSYFLLCTYLSSHFDNNRHNHVSAFTIPRRRVGCSNRNEENGINYRKKIKKERGAFCTSSSSAEQIKIKTLYDVKIEEFFSSSNNHPRLCLDYDNAMEGLVSHAPESLYVIDEAVRRFHDNLIQTMLPKERDMMVNLNLEDIVTIMTRESNLTEQLANDIHCLAVFLVKPIFFINLEITITTNKQPCSMVWSVEKLNNKDDLSVDMTSRLRIRIINMQKQDEEEASSPSPHQIVEECYWSYDKRITRIQSYQRMTCLELCHEALKKSIDSSSQTNSSYDNEIQSIIIQLEVRILCNIRFFFFDKKEAENV